MRKKLDSCISRGTRFILLFLAVCFGSVAASAVDFGEMQLDTEYEFPGGFQRSTGTFTPDFSGELLYWACNSDIHIYADADYTQLVNYTFKSYEHLGEALINVVAGTTYYIMGDPYSPTVFKMMRNEDVPLALRWTIPGEGEVFDLTQYSDIDFIFNQKAYVESAEVGVMTDGEWKYSPISGSKTAEQISYPFAATLRSMLSANTVKPGDEVRIRLKNVRKGDVNGNLWDQLDSEGYAIFTFKAGSIPVTLTSTDNISEFLSYWPAGDPAGIITMHFDGAILPGSASATFSYGSSEGELGVNFYIETLPVKVEGNTVTIDCTGKRRTVADMITSGTLNSKVTIDVNSIRDQYGNAVSTGEYGMVGSKTFEYDYKQIARADIYSEFTPENGGSLEGVSSINVWIKGLNSMTFDGFKFTYPANGAENTVIVPLESVTKQNVSADGDDAEFVFTIPAEVVGKKNITVTLDNLVTLDGYDHSSAVMAVYDGFTLTYVSPADGSYLEALAANAEITVRTNYADKYPELYMTYKIVDLNPTNPDEAILKDAWLNRQDNGSYVAVNPQYIKMVVGHEYQVTFTAYENEMAMNYGYEPLGEATIIWHGATPPFRFSDIEFVSVTPSTDTMLTADDQTFTVVYNGLVRIDTDRTFINMGMGATTPFRSITPVEPEDINGTTYANTWALQLPEGYLDNISDGLELSVVAYDEEARLVQGNEGQDESSFLYLHYDVASSYADFDVYPDPETALNENVVSSLSKLIVFNENGIMPSYAVDLSEAVVFDQYYTEVAHVADVIPYIPAEEEENFNYVVTESIVVLDQEITAGGNYSIYFPANYFTIGTELNQRKSAEKMAAFTVAGQFTATPTPAEGDVENLSSIKIKFSNGIMATEMAGNPTITKTGGEPVEITDVVIPTDEYNPWVETVTLNLPAKITEPGEYTVIIPARYFYIQGSYAYTDELTFVYNVTNEPIKLPITYDPAEGQVTTLGPSIRITYDEEESVATGQGLATMTIDDNEPFRLPDAEYDFDCPDFNLIVQPLGDTYTAYGTYTITFPAGYFLLGWEGERESVEMTVTYTITSSSAITSIAADANGVYVVYNINGVKVLETTDAAELSNLVPGFYIINGAKYIIK